MQRVLPQLRPFSRRTFSATTLRTTAWSPGPSPPRLPKGEQEIFEQLQRESTGAFSTPQRAPQINQSPHFEPPAPSKSNAANSSQQFQMTQSSENKHLQKSEESLGIKVKTGDGEELHPNIRRGALPEFEGEINPKTGEAGGPKNEPLRWGHTGDWSYNGRVTDF